VRVLGLDPGSRRTGWGVVERHGNRYTAVAFGQATAPAAMPLPRRLHLITRAIEDVIEAHRPDWVALEDAFYHESVRSTLVLGHVRGALIVAALGRGCEVAEYAPRAIKLAVTGSGASAKEQVAFMVRRVLEVRGPLPIDASDGLAAALCHLQRADSRPGAGGSDRPAARAWRAALAAAAGPERPAARRLREALAAATGPARGRVRIARRGGG
jgi:crossover junction endodeoxyribonuclease RuvC